MALTNSGFDGTVTEASWANMSALSGVDAVESSAAWAITQGTGRQVSAAAHSGYAFARGLLSKDTAAILTSLSTPTNGQWFLIVRHIVWSTNTVTVAAVAHTTTTTTIPTVAPSTYPTIDNNPGVLYDQKLGWAWVRSTDTTVTLFDLRTLSAESRVAAVEADITALEAADTAITTVRQIKTYKVADTTALNALTGMGEGDIADQADTDATYRYSGSAWVRAWRPDAVGTVTATTGGTVDSTTRLVRSGNVVVMNLTVNRTTAPSAGTVIAVVPTGFRPEQRASGGGLGAPAVAASILVEANGDVLLYGSSATGNNFVSASWIIES